jgi:predicted nuclease of predicted toxin-antitoxin system
MLVKLDENLGISHVALLKKSGYEVDRVHDEGLSGEPDATIWKSVCAEKRYFITIDLDFADVRQYPPGSHPGIHQRSYVVARPMTPSHPHFEPATFRAGP